MGTGDYGEDYILENPQKAINMTLAGLSAQIGVSEGSVINFAGTVGISGFTLLKINMAQNLSGTDQFVLDDVKAGDTPQGVFAKLSENAALAFRETCDILQNNDMPRAAELLMNAITGVQCLVNPLSAGSMLILC